MTSKGWVGHVMFPVITIAWMMELAIFHFVRNGLNETALSVAREIANSEFFRRVNSRYAIRCEKWGINRSRGECVRVSLFNSVSLYVPVASVRISCVLSKGWRIVFRDEGLAALD